MPSTQPPRKNRSPQSAPSRTTSPTTKAGSPRLATKPGAAPKSGTAQKPPAASGARPHQKSRPGPKPDQPNFAFRRLIVVFAGLALVGGIAWGGYSIFGWVSGQISDRTAPAPTVEATGPSVDELANPVQCAADALEVGMTFPETVTAGSSANLGLTLTNAGEVSCLTDTGYVESTIRIYSGNDLIWDRAHCGHGPQNREILLNVGANDAFTLVWPGARSDVGCPGGLPPIEPGTYRVEVTADASGNAEPLKQVFIVSAG